MSEKIGIEKSKKFVEAMDDLVELGEDLMKDGKIDLGDIMHLPKAGEVLPKVFMAAKEYKEILKEMKDLDAEEFKQLMDEAFDN